MRTLIPGVIAMTAIVVASNILVQYPLGAFLTWGALTYPFAFLVTDLTNRLKGPAAARRAARDPRLGAGGEGRRLLRPDG